MTIQSHRLNFILNPNVSLSVHDNGIVLLHIASGQIFASNRTGAQILRGLEEQQSLNTIVDGITQVFHIDNSTATAHVIGFVAQLERHALIQKREVL